jgi:hypothetical protein
LMREEQNHSGHNSKKLNENNLIPKVK